MYSRGRKREHSKVCIRQVTLSAGNPISAGFIGCRVPNLSSLSCIEISHFSKRCAGRCDKKLNKQTYRSGRNEIDSKSIWQQCHVGSNPTVCAKSSTLRGAAFYFCGKLCKGCKVRFEQPVPGALRPAGLQQSCGLLQGRGRIPPPAPSITTQFHIG